MWPSLITGGLGLLGSFMSSEQSAKNTEAQQQMQMQSEQWQEHMSNTAYQRSSADMKAAGLNPMMMFGSGGPASTPSPVVQPTPQTKSPFADIGAIAKDAIGSAIQAKTLDKMVEEISNLQATRNETIAKTASEEERPSLIRKQAGKTAQEWETEGEVTEKARSEAHKAKMVQDLVDDPVTRKVLQGGVLGSSAADFIKPATDIVNVVGSSALKSALIRKYGNATEYNHSATSWRKGYDAAKEE